MTGSIEINNLRNIRKLCFDIPDRGVSLLTAGNGAGKTSLLGCIRRIGHSNAFPLHFPSSLRSERLDNHSNGTITYSINGESVEYAYRGERWTPRPRKNSSLFGRFGYASVTYIGATAERITPRPEDFEPNRIKAAGNTLKEAANTIFETNKFEKLRTINPTRGAGIDAFVLSLGGNPQKYHSEKHFSLGELCVLKLLRFLMDVPNNSMIIIDELEMALHPRAQVNLLRYLEDQATEKSLTIIFSTHSVTLLKAVKKDKIIYLEKQSDGEVKPIYGCYPTYAIGNIASVEETLPDIMIYVEDVFAREVTCAFFDMFVNEMFDDPTMRPSVKVVPVGGFKEVVNFLERNRSVLPDRVTQKAVLDEDVKSETVAIWNDKENHAQLEKFQRLHENILYLPFTPEVGIMKYIVNNQDSFQKRLRERCRDNLLQIGDIVVAFNSDLEGAALRKNAKEAIFKLQSLMQRRTQRSEDAVREELCGVFAKLAWADYRRNFMEIFGHMT